MTGKSRALCCGLCERCIVLANSPDVDDGFLYLGPRISLLGALDQHCFHLLLVTEWHQTPGGTCASTAESNRTVAARDGVLSRIIGHIAHSEGPIT